MTDYLLAHVDLIGFIAAFLGTISLMPQAIKLFLSRSTHGISLVMYLIITIDSILWIIYGCALDLTPLLVQSVIVLTCALAIVIMKLLWK